jgi:hypothetical protein
MLLDRFAQLLGVPTTVAALLIALAIAQLATQIYALADLARRDTVLGDRKWPWALGVALGNLPGAIIYLVVGRTVAEVPVDDAASRTSGTDGDATRRALDQLYNPRDTK